jgi:hypothetical protein
LFCHGGRIVNPYAINSNALNESSEIGACAASKV